MIDANKNLQDIFLEKVIKTASATTVYLTNGVKLHGCVIWFDNNCLLLAREGRMQLLYKHAISTVYPDEPIDLGSVFNSIISELKTPLVKAA